ncbi:hypothetical protein J1N35_015676 [Gossypium stocksii]|uniref:Uncharacterized protein n=1 Tax=Gossypium stocksii TaxID=47602 RepID=A0A9D3VWN0_9ROSI|nr:hypothetical protein J1N35_015676 [Gossypium stocksii]
MDINRRYAKQNKLKQVAGYEAGKDSYVNGYDVRVHFSKNLQLLPQHSRDAANKLMTSTVNNSGLLLTICMAYTSIDEIIHAVKKCWEEKWVENDDGIISLEDIEK